jgi:tetratricopeptide (TPR) repeat protein
MLGRLDEARTDLEKARDIGNEIGHLLTRAQAYGGLGELACKAGNYDEGLRHFKTVLGMTDIDHSPLPMILFAVTGIAHIYAVQEKYREALELLTLVLRYPPNFIAMVEDNATKLLDELTQKLDKDFIQSTMSQSKSLVLKHVIHEILAE